MNDLAAIRTEIKAWERNFRSKQGRDPSVDDIKKLPDIAQKYKLYKKLSRVAAVPALPTSSQSQSPSTPTRSSRPRSGLPSLAGLNSRVVATAAPLSTFNPFSPQKAKGKERETFGPRITQPIFNPFSSPAKSRSSNGVTSQAGPKPDRPPSPPVPSSAVSRARKRLRGEPVSPSPSKDKRRRTGLQTTLNFPRLTLGSSKRTSTSFRLTDEDESEEGTHGASFVDDSPVKSTTGRTFNLLFDESQPSPNADIFGLKKDSSSKKSTPPLMLSNGKIFPTTTQAEATGSQQPLLPPTTDESCADTTGEVFEDIEGTSVMSDNRRSKSPLLPPSPPPASSMPKGPVKGKRKGDSKAYAIRKKMKLSNNGGTDDEESTSDASDLKGKVKIVERPQVKKISAEDDMDSDFDPVLDRPRMTRDPAPAVQFDAQAVQVNLPDRFKEVLDLDTTHWQAQEMEEDNLVKSLLYGRRTTTYDSKKGEIWDVGEEVEFNSDEKREDIDDEWEGEPVPWLMAEM